MNIMEKNRGERLILLYQNLPKGKKKVSIRPTPIAFSKHEAGAHQYPYLYG